MTEIPDHLLQRSRDRRAALGLGGGDGPPAEGGGEAPAPAAEAASTEVAPAAPTPAAASAPAPAPPPPPPPPPPFVVAAERRRKIPVWAVPVVAVLPIWGFVYAGALAVPEGELDDPELVIGQEVYRNCAGCHGAQGQGGTGRPLSDGDVLLTFPDIEDHIAWIEEGSDLVGGAGNPYGDPDRPGGQRISGSEGYGQMAGWGGTLSAEEIRAVARYEREVLSGGAAEGGEAEGAEGAEGGEGGEGGGQVDEDEAGGSDVEGGPNVGESDADGGTPDGGADANDSEGGGTAGAGDDG